MYRQAVELQMAILDKEAELDELLAPYLETDTKPARPCNSLRCAVGSIGNKIKDTAGSWYHDVGGWFGRNRPVHCDCDSEKYGVPCHEACSDRVALLNDDMMASQDGETASNIDASNAMQPLSKQNGQAPARLRPTSQPSSEQDDSEDASNHPDPSEVNRLPAMVKT